MPTDDDVFNSMEPACRAAWNAFVTDDLSRLTLFKMAWDLGAASTAPATVPRRPAIEEKKPTICLRPLATIPRDGRYIWVQRRAHHLVKEPIRCARWVKHNGPTGGRWMCKGQSTTMYDDIIIGWEPVE